MYHSDWPLLDSVMTQTYICDRHIDITNQNLAEFSLSEQKLPKSRPLYKFPCCYIPLIFLGDEAVDCIQILRDHFF